MLDAAHRCTGYLVWQLDLVPRLTISGFIHLLPYAFMAWTRKTLYMEIQQVLEL
jgi:hypothetical protein